MKTFLMLLVGVFAALAITGCGGSTYLQDGKMKDSITEQNITDRYVEVVGIGRADPNIADTTGKRAVSRNAAVVDAQYRLAGIINGIQISGGVTIQKAMETDSKISASVDSMIKGAQTMKTEWTHDDGCMVTMRLDKQGLAKQLGVKFQ